MSEDEKVTRDILLSECRSAVVQVGDAKKPEPTLAITLQIAEWVSYDPRSQHE